MRVAILAHEKFPGDAKTALGVLRYGDHDVVAVLDRDSAGTQVDDHVDDVQDAPIVSGMSAVDASIDALIIGVAPIGGGFDESWRADVVTALERGCDVIAGLQPLDGARAFLDELRAETQVVLLSDTFEQFARPLMRQLGWPTVFCHRLVVQDDRIVDYRLRQPDQKQRSVEAFRSLNYRVVAAGDSYNDTTMLGAADAGFLFHAPPNVIAEFPQFPALDTYDDLLAAIRTALTA